MAVSRIVHLYPLALASLLVGCGPGPRDWHVAAIEDVDAVYSILKADHPATAPGEDPAFSEQLETAYGAARDMALAVDDFGGYLYTLRYLTTGFHDEHLVIQLFEAGERDRAWPGFSVALEGDDLFVEQNTGEGAPPLGSRLVSCDGLPTPTLLEERVAPYIGNWALPGKRPGDASYVLLETGNPFIQPLSACQFEADGEMIEHTLSWQSVTSDRLSEITDRYEVRIEPKTELRTLDRGMVWVSLADFDRTNPESKASLDAVIDQLQTDRSRLAEGAALVLDVRGNRGGSSETAREVARAVWGIDAVERIRPRIEEVDWRASQGNLEAIDTILPGLEKAFDDDASLVVSIREVRDAIAAALESGSEFATVPPTETQPFGPSVLEVPGPVFFLTDHSCVSACLDFADIVLRMDRVTHVGRRTAGDTSYLDVRAQPLPSGASQLAFPISVHRGRERADNADYVPELLWEGDLRDLEGLEAWIAELAERTEPIEETKADGT